MQKEEGRGLTTRFAVFAAFEAATVTPAAAAAAIDLVNLGILNIYLLNSQFEVSQSKAVWAKKSSISTARVVDGDIRIQDDKIEVETEEEMKQKILCERFHSIYLSTWPIYLAIPYVCAGGVQYLIPIVARGVVAHNSLRQ